MKKKILITLMLLSTTIFAFEGTDRKEDKLEDQFEISNRIIMVGDKALAVDEYDVDIIKDQAVLKIELINDRNNTVDSVTQEQYKDIASQFATKIKNETKKGTKVDVFITVEDHNDSERVLYLGKF